MDEYIKREAALQEIERREAFAVGDKLASIGAIKSFIKNRPAVDVAPVVHGRWIPIRESEMTGWDPAVAGRDPIGGYICSVCKEEAVYDCNDEFVLSKYCPNCGAKMENDEDGGKNMTIERAIEILNPDHREHYDGMEEVNEACRMGMEALEQSRGIPVDVRMPEKNVPVLGWYKDNPFSPFRPEVVAWNGKGWVFVYAQRYVTDVTHYEADCPVLWQCVPWCEYLQETGGADNEM